MAEIYAARNKSFWHRDALTRWLFKCCMATLQSVEGEEGLREEELVFESLQQLHLRLSTRLSLLKYKSANMEDFLEEFPRLPPEANPLDPALLAPGAPLLPPAQPMHEFRFPHRRGVQEMAAAAGIPDEILAQILAVQEPGLEAELHALLGDLERRGDLPRGRDQEHGTALRDALRTGNLNPEMPLMQLFIQTFFPWNRFDPQGRDN